MKKKPFEYDCGHKTDGVIIMDNNPLGLSTYISWAIEDKNLKTQKQCFDCYLKELSE